MKSNRNVLALVVILGVVVLACNLPAAGAGTPPATEPPTEISAEDLAATYVAQTATAKAAESPAATQEPGDEKVTVSVSLATNCRTGPDAGYQLLMTVQPGSTFDVVGKYTPKTYWIINMPTGGTCWLWGQYASVTGDTSKLPEIAAPAPPPVAQSSDSNSNQSDNTNDSNNSNDSSDNDNSTVPLIPLVPIQIFVIPNAPTNVDISRSCVTLTKPGDLFPSFKQTTTFTWTDASTNETGFNIFKDGTKVASLSPNTQKYIDEFVVLLAQSPTVSYGVQAFTDTGVSSTVSASVSYCK